MRVRPKFARCLVAATVFVLLGPYGRPNALASEECGQCQIKLETKKKLKDSEAEYSDLLRRNKEFLAKVGPSDNSRLIKLSSNITLINIKLDGIQKSIAELDADLAKDHCTECPPNEPGSVPSGAEAPASKRTKGK